MAWKIKNIHIENFKLFLHPFDLSPDGKNVLIYGENGSGKSSIYWAIYTHFQSCLKEPTDTDAGKYFNDAHPDNLRNLYDTEGRRSGIDITFVDKDDIVRYFSQGSERIFPRTKSVIGRTVSNCHPPASVHIVEKIVEDFKF